MNKELKNHFDKLEQNVTTHLDKFEQEIINDFSRRFGKLEKDFKT